MATRVLLTLRTDSERAGDLLGFLELTLPSTRTAPGCGGLSLCRRPDSAASFVVDQQWESREAYLAYARWRRERGDLKPFDTLLTAPPELVFLDVLATW